MTEVLLLAAIICPYSYCTAIFSKVVKMAAYTALQLYPQYVCTPKHIKIYLPITFKKSLINGYFGFALPNISCYSIMSRTAILPSLIVLTLFYIYLFPFYFKIS